MGGNMRVAVGSDDVYDVAKFIVDELERRGFEVVRIAANKVRGVRAALCFDAYSIRGARLWNDANALALSARLTSNIIAREIIDAWLGVKEIDQVKLKIFSIFESKCC